MSFTDLTKAILNSRLGFRLRPWGVSQSRAPTVQCIPWISDQVETQELDRLPVWLHRTEEQSNSQKRGRARLEPIVMTVQFKLPTRQEGAQPYLAGRKGTLEALPSEMEAEPDW